VRNWRTLSLDMERGRPDLALLGGVLALASFGVFMVYSSTKVALIDAGYDPAYYLKRQIIWVSAGFAIMLLGALLDYRRFELASTPAYCLGIAAILGVYVIGNRTLGATRWYKFGSVQIQPSEFMVLAVILALATFVARRPEGLTSFDLRRMLLLVGIPLVLIAAQPDLGTALVITFTTAVMFMMAGVPPRFIVLLTILGVLGAVFAVSFGILRSFQVARLVAFLHQNYTGTNQNMLDLIRQVVNGKSAIGAGGIWGVGPFQGLQTTLGYVPEQRTDFIFTAVGEQLGWIGSCILLSLMGFIAWRLFVIARDASGVLARMLVSGVFVFFSFSVFQNIGMTMGIMPVTGIPLPFMSYGGSSTLVFSIAMGTALSVSRRTGN
jgi:rod shape determining protein RodA